MANGIGGISNNKQTDHISTSTPTSEKKTDYFTTVVPKELVSNILNRIGLADVPNVSRVFKLSNQIIHTNDFWKNKLQETFGVTATDNCENLFKEKLLFQKKLEKIFGIKPIGKPTEIIENITNLSIILAGALPENYKNFDFKSLKENIHTPEKVLFDILSKEFDTKDKQDAWKSLMEERHTVETATQYLIEKYKCGEYF